MKSVARCGADALWVAASAAAQSMAAVVGSVVDQTGAPLTGVRVTIRGVAVRTADTGAAGDFAFPDLPEGDYEISAELSGFERQRRNVRVRAGERITVSFTLRVALVDRDDRHGRQGGRARCSGDPRRDHRRLAGRSRPSGNPDHRRGAGAGALGDVLAEHRLGPAHDPRDRDERRVCRSGSQFGDLSRRRVPRSARDGVRALSRSGAHRGASRAAGHLVWTERRRRRDEPHPRPPTNDLQASAHVTAGNFGELRADARVSGPLKRDRVMGSVAFARGVRDGFVRDLEHPDHPLGGDDDTAARGQLHVVFDRRTNLLLSSDVDHQTGIPLTYNKVLVAKPGYQFDNPPDFHDVRSSLARLESTRCTTARAPV